MNNRVPWSLAAKNGLFLSLITVAIEVPASMVHNMPTFLSTLLLFIKIAGSYTLLFYFAKKYTLTLQNTSFGEAFKFSLSTCLFSSIVCTLAALVTFTLLVPDLIPNMLDEVFAELETMGMSETLDYNMMLKKMPALLVISKMFSCMFWGLIFSLLTATFTKTRNANPFATPEE